MPYTTNQIEFASWIDQSVHRPNRNSATKTKDLQQTIARMAERDLNKDNFDYVIDIGANYGLFTGVFAKLYPSAKIFAYEPVSEIYEALNSNLKSFLPARAYKKIKLFREALGAGGPSFVTTDEISSEANLVIQTQKAKIGYHPWSGQDKHATFGHKSERVETRTLKEIIKINNIDLNKKILLKCDCEGGEENLLNEESTKILKSIDNIILEIHFNPHHDGCLDWPVYDNWVQENFGSSEYYCSNRRRGYGHYLIDNNS